MEAAVVQSPAIITNRNIWFVSDQHYGHQNILKFKTPEGNPLREFDSVEHMNETMIENHNRVVKDSDIVYNCGDVFFGEGWKALPRLKGRKRLILGNHDTAKNQYILNNFQKILMWRMFPEFGIVVTHVPIHTGSFEMRAMVNVHGHTHRNWVMKVDETGKEVVDKNYFNVCVENHNYTPIHLDELQARIRA